MDESELRPNDDTATDDTALDDAMTDDESDDATMGVDEGADEDPEEGDEVEDADEDEEDEQDEEDDEDDDDEDEEEEDDDEDDEEEDEEEEDDDEDDEDDEDLADEEAEHATVASAATVETAKRLALDGLRKIVPVVDEADVEFVVLEEGNKGGFFGRGKMEAQVEARLRLPGAAPVVSDEGPPPGAEVLRAFVQGVVDRMGIEASVEGFDTPEALRAEIKGDDLGILIGRHGTTIDALQYIAAIAVNGDRRLRRQVVVDAEGYRVRREVSLKALADRAAQKVARESSSMQLKPMTAAERKVIHLYLKDDPRVETTSEGQEPFRAVVVSPSPRRG
jgi:spoIIIJ-associated protein